MFWQSFTKIKDPIKSTSKIFLCFLFFFDSFLGNQTESEESRVSVRLWKRSVMMSEKKKKSNFTRRPKKNEKIYLNSELSSWPINSVMRETERETVKVRKCRGVRQRKKEREREKSWVGTIWSLPRGNFARLGMTFLFFLFDEIRQSGLKGLKLWAQS